MTGQDRMVTVELAEGLRAEARTDKHVVTLDEPVADGGTDQGMTPVQHLLVALGGCSAITMRLYAQRKGWDLAGARVTVFLRRPGGKEAPSVTQEIELRGDLDEEQCERLRQIAGRCPVHRLVDGPLETDEKLV